MSTSTPNKDRRDTAEGDATSSETRQPSEEDRKDRRPDADDAKPMDTPATLPPD